jgi:hypothetical protein
LLIIITAAEFRVKSVLEKLPTAMKDDPELKDITKANEACWRGARADYGSVQSAFFDLRDWIRDKQVYKRPQDKDLLEELVKEMDYDQTLLGIQMDNGIDPQ